MRTAWISSLLALSFGVSVSSAQIEVSVTQRGRPIRVSVVTYGIDAEIEVRLTSNRDEFAQALKRASEKYAKVVKTARTLAIEYAVRLLAEGAGGPARGRVILAMDLWSSNSTIESGSSPDEPMIERLLHEDTSLSALLDHRFFIQKDAAPYTTAEFDKLRQQYPEFYRLDSTAPGYRVDNLAHIAAETGGGVVVLPAEQRHSGPAHSFTLLRYRFVVPAGGEAGRRLASRGDDLSPSAKQRYPDARIR